MRPGAFAVAAALLLWPEAARAQTPAPQAPPASPSVAQPPPSAPGQAAPAPPAGEVYSYQPEGRRDPFVNLLGTGTEPRLASRRGEGPAGFSVGEISVRGVLESRGAMVAMIQGPDNKTYLVHQGDKLLDGTIKTINQQGLIISQEVNDPLSIVKQREIRKLLRSLEGGKE